jgi:YrhK-like protein
VGARPITTEGPGRFITRAVYEADGVEREWVSRAHRKRGRLGATGVPAWRTRSWWIAVLFMIGSACFAIGAVPGYVSLVGVAADGVTFFVGSIFFTSAGYLQYLEVIETAPAPDGGRNHFRLASWEPRRIDWLATVIQLAGTIFFNLSTFRAMMESFDADPASLLVWRPDALGSVCFLVASWLAYAEAGHDWLSWRPGDLGWRIAALNLAGSIFFGFSAIGAYVVPSTDDLVSAALANGGTLLGAIGFFIGAALLLPEAMKPPASAAPHTGLTPSRAPRRMR